MATTPPAKISYINKTYEDERRELLARAPIVSNGTWTDLNNAELLVALSEIMLGSSDMMRFYFDHQANEAFLEKARERKNVIAHSNQIGHRIKSWTSAVGSVSVKLTKNVIGYISVPQYTKLWSADGLPYYTITETFLSDGIPFSEISLSQGDIQTINYTSNGILDQRFIIDSQYIAEGSITVKVDGQIWSFVDDDFAKSGPASTNFILETVHTNAMYVVFGDGVSGKIPTLGSTIEITWANTKGPLGNIEENLIIRFDRPIDELAIVYSSNFSGGAVPETIEEAKKLGPMLLRALWRGTSKEDVVALTEDYPGVKQASVLDINDFPLYSFKVSYHETWVVVIPENDNLMSETMKSSIQVYLEERKYVTNNIQVIDAEYISIDIDVTVYKKKEFDQQVIESGVVDSINDIFTIAKSPIASYRMLGYVDGLVLGEDFRYSNLVYAIQSVPGVAYIELSTPTSDTPMNYQQIPILGELRVNVLDAVGIS
jgi:hypothetical protein